MIIVANSTILGKNLKYLREKNGMSLFEMAKLIDMEVNVLECLEEGIIFKIEYPSLKKVYENFEENLDHLFDRLMK